MKENIDMVNGPLFKNLVIFSIPFMISKVLQIAFNAADVIVVGRFAGSQALAAVGATTSICFLLTALFNGLSIGSNVVIAKYYGKNDPFQISDAVHTSITTAILSGIIIMIIGLLFSRPILEFMDTPDDIIDMSELYLKIYFSGGIFLLIYNFGSAILRAKGDTKRPLIFLVISGIINIILNIFCVVVLHLSVAGVGISTVVSWIVSTILIFNTLIHEEGELKFSFSKLKIQWHMFKEIINIGIPAGVQGMMFSISNIVIQSSINSFNSSIIVAANSAGTSVNQFIYISMSAFAEAGMTFTSQNIGAAHYENIKKIVERTFVLVVIVGITVGALANIFNTFCLSLYTNDPEVVEIGKICLRIVGAMYVFNGTLDVFVGSSRGMGHSTVPMVVTVVGICGFRLLWLWTVFPIIHKIEVIYLSYPISWIITTILQFIVWCYYFKKLPIKKDSLCWVTEKVWGLLQKFGA